MNCGSYVNHKFYSIASYGWTITCTSTLEISRCTTCFYPLKVLCQRHKLGLAWSFHRVMNVWYNKKRQESWLKVRNFEFLPLIVLSTYGKMKQMVYLHSTFYNSKRHVVLKALTENKAIYFSKRALLYGPDRP